MGRNVIDNLSDPLAVTALSIAGGTYNFPTYDGTASQILVTNGTGTVTWQSFIPATGYGWSEITGDTPALVKHAYICNGAVVLTITLPSTFALGDTVFIVGKGIGGWRVEPNTGDIIYHLSDSANDTQYFESGDPRTCIRIHAITSNSEWEITKVEGDISVGP